MLVRISGGRMKHVLVASLLLLRVLVFDQLHHLSLLLIHFCGGPLVRTVSAKLDGETNLCIVGMFNTNVQRLLVELDLLIVWRVGRILLALCFGSLQVEVDATLVTGRALTVGLVRVLLARRQEHGELAVVILVVVPSGQSEDERLRFAKNVNLRVLTNELPQTDERWHLGPQHMMHLFVVLVVHTAQHLTGALQGGENTLTSFLHRLRHLQADLPVLLFRASDWFRAFVGCR